MTIKILNRPVALKTCTLCGEAKPLDNFYYNRKNKVLYSRYKPCFNVKVREWQAANPEKRKANQNAWRAKNVSAAISAVDRWRAEHKEQLLQSARDYRKLNAEKIKMYHRIYRAKRRAQQEQLESKAA